MTEQIVTPEKEQKRAGQTIVTSVSISKEFKDLMDNHEISPTWAIRKGIAMELFERGIAEYQSDLNKERSKGIRELLRSFEELGDLEDRKKKLIRQLEDYQDEIEKILKLLK